MPAPEGDPRSTRHGPSALARAGRGLLVAAAVVVLFVAYQLWGTAFAHWRGQQDLRSRFDQEVAAARRADPGGVGRTIAYPAVGDPVGVLVIPRIGVDQVVVEGVGATQLAEGPGHYPGTALPGQSGNAAVAGHRTTHGAPFNGLGELGPGDVVSVTTLQGTFTYRVTRSFVVSPDDVAVLDPTTSPQLTLTTCTPKYSAAERLVVDARLTGPPAAITPAPTRTTGSLAGADPADSPTTWLVLAGSVVALAAVVVGVGSRRRRTGSTRAARGLTVAAVVVGLLLLLVAFGALDALLPQSL